MGSTVVREFVVIVGGIGLATWLTVSTIRQIRQQGASPSLPDRLSLPEAAARLTLGTELMLIALLLLAGGVFTMPSAVTAAPGWMLALGAVLLVTAALSGTVVVTFIVARWRQPRAR